MSFTITSTEFPTTATEQGYGASAGLVIGPAEDVGVALADYQEFQNPDLEIEELAPVPAFDNIITIQLPDDGSYSVATVELDGVTYTAGSAANVPGTFYVNPANQELTIYLSDDVGPTAYSEDTANAGTAGTYYYNPATQAVEAYQTDAVSVTTPTTAEGFTIENVVTVSIGSTTYVPGSEGATDPGTFNYSEPNQSITIYPITGNPPQPGETVRYTAIQNKPYVHNFYDYTGTIPRLWQDLNITGVSLDRSLGQAPGGSVTFSIHRDDFNPCDFAEGKKIFEWDGKAYAVGGVSASRSPLNRDGLLDVTLTLQGPHDHKLDDQVKYRGAIAESAVATEGLITSRGSQTPAEVKATVNISFANLCARGGVSFIGDDVTIKIDKERDTRDSTTIGNELGRARAVESYAYFSNPNGFEFRRWFNPTVHTISRREILNGDDSGETTPYEIQYNTLGNKWGRIPLAVEYRNTQLEIDQSEGLETGENGRLNTVIVKNSGSALRGTTVLWVPPSGIDRSNPSAAFDQGGYTMDFTRERIENGVRTSYTKTVYGYAFKVSDFAIISGNGNQSTIGYLPAFQQPRLQGWGQVREEREEYEFDADGYLIRIVRTITTKRRFKQETARRESIELLTLATYGTSSDAGLQADARAAYNSALGLYDYFDVTEEDVTEFELASLENIYPDLPPLEDGEPERKYVTRETRTHRSYYQSSDLGAIRVDADGNAFTGSQTFTVAGSSTDFSVDVDGLTVSTGVDYEEVLERSLSYPWPNITEAQYRSEDDQYAEKLTIKKASGENLKNVESPAPTTTDYQGKLPFATRLEIFEDGNDPVEDDEPEEERKVLLNTPGNGLSTTTDPIDGTVSFPSTYNRDDAYAAAVCDISIANTRAVEVWSNVLVAPTRNYCVGDLIRYDGVDYRILSIADTPEIQGDRVTREPLVMSWGRDIDLRNNVSLDEVD